MSVGARIEPCADAGLLRAYIDANWRAGHVLAVDESMFRFTYMTPWVDRSVFPAGISVLTVMESGRMLGFLGAICAPYPRPRSFWLALWHVRPELKGTGLGGRLLAEMQAIALGGEGARTGWIGTFGAGPEAMPVYLKRGYAVRAGRRWLFDPEGGGGGGGGGGVGVGVGGPISPRAEGEVGPDGAWLSHRFAAHPVYRYETAEGGSIYRTERNGWGRVTHAVRLGAEGYGASRVVYERERGVAEREGTGYLMDAWAFECPGRGWSLAGEGVPSVFHPPEARGSTTYAVGLPFVPSRIHKGDCDQDRPNGVAGAGAVVVGAARGVGEVGAVVGAG